MRVTLPDGTRFLGVHASPGQDDGSGISAARDAEEFLGLLADSEADLLCVGHTHRPWDSRIQGVHIVNLGAISLSLTDDKYASYVLLNAQTDMYTIEHRRVPYDRGAVIDQLKRIGHPGREYFDQALI